MCEWVLGRPAGQRGSALDHSALARAHTFPFWKVRPKRENAPFLSQEGHIARFGSLCRHRPRGHEDCLAKQHALPFPSTAVTMPLDRPKTPLPFATAEEEDQTLRRLEEKLDNCTTATPHGIAAFACNAGVAGVATAAGVAGLLLQRVGVVKRPVAALPSVRKPSGVAKSARFGLPRQMTHTIDASKAAALVKPIPLRPLSRPRPRPRPGAGVLQTIPEHGPD